MLYSRSSPGSVQKWRGEARAFTGFHGAAHQYLGMTDIVAAILEMKE